MVVNIPSLKRQLSGELNNYFQVNGYAQEEIENGSLYSLVVKDKNEYVDIYLYAEIDVSNFFTIEDALNKIVLKFDPSSYFDVLGPQIYGARIYKSSLKDTATEDVITQSNLIKFGNLVSNYLEDEYDEEFWVEDVAYNDRDHRLGITIFSDSFESTANIQIFAEDVDSYDQFVKLYKDVTVKELEFNIKNI